MLEDYPNILTELSCVSRLPGRESVEIRRKVLLEKKQEVEDFVETLPTAKERLVARQVLRYGAPIPWTAIARTMGHRWTTDQLRYQYKRLCSRYFTLPSGKGN